MAAFPTNYRELEFQFTGLKSGTPLFRQVSEADHVWATVATAALAVALSVGVIGGLKLLTATGLAKRNWIIIMATTCPVSLTVAILFAVKAHQTFKKNEEKITRDTVKQLLDNEIADNKSFHVRERARALKAEWFPQENA